VGVEVVEPEVVEGVFVGFGWGGRHCWMVPGFWRERVCVVGSVK
jgi:hypothetical protein